VREEIAVTQKHAGAHQVETVRDMESFLIGHKRRIDAVRIEARDLMRIAEDKQEALILAARERKVLVKLKEKRQTEHNAWLNRVEQKDADDQTMARQAWQQIRGRHGK
jgi:flagellar export protein FliJ